MHTGSKIFEFVHFILKLILEKGNLPCGGFCMDNLCLQV